MDPYIDLFVTQRSACPVVPGKLLERENVLKYWYFIYAELGIDSCFLV